MEERKSKTKRPPGFKVIHVLPDGTEVDSVKGMKIPYLPETKFIYELAVKYLKYSTNDEDYEEHKEEGTE